MISKVYENLAPGGWAEFQEWAVEVIGENEAAEAVVRDSALRQWCDKGVQGGASFGRDFRAAHNYRQWMVEAGFEDIVEKQILCPVNGWPVDPDDRLLGNWFSLDVIKGVKGTAKLLEAAGLPPESIPGFMDAVCDNVTHRAMRAYSPRKLNQILNSSLLLFTDMLQIMSSTGAAPVSTKPTKMLRSICTVTWLSCPTVGHGQMVRYAIA